jgi:hypothetical protein
VCKYCPIYPCLGLLNPRQIGNYIFYAQSSALNFQLWTRMLAVQHTLTILFFIFYYKKVLKAASVRICTVFYSQSCDQSIIYRGPNFLAFVWFGSMPAPSPPLPSSNCLSFSVFPCVADPAYWRERGCTWSRIIPLRESLGFYKSSILSAWGQKCMLPQEKSYCQR